MDSEYAMVVSGKKRKCIGYFKSDEDARIALAHTVFGTTNKTRYEIIEEEDATNHKREEGLLSSLMSSFIAVTSAIMVLRKRCLIS